MCVKWWSSEKKHENHMTNVWKKNTHTHRKLHNKQTENKVINVCVKNKKQFEYWWSCYRSTGTTNGILNLNINISRRKLSFEMNGLKLWMTMILLWCNKTYVFFMATDESCSCQDKLMFVYRYGTHTQTHTTINIILFTYIDWLIMMIVFKMINSLFVMIRINRRR